MVTTNPESFSSAIDAAIWIAEMAQAEAERRGTPAKDMSFGIAMAGITTLAEHHTQPNGRIDQDAFLRQITRLAHSQLVRTGQMRPDQALHAVVFDAPLQQKGGK